MLIVKVDFPIFLQDKDGYMYLVSDINSEVEIVDVEDKEYKAWDSKGIPIELYLDKKEIKVKIISNNTNLEELKEAILNYAKISKPSSPFIYDTTESNMVALFRVAEKHIKAGSFIQRVRSLFRKKLV